MRIRHILEENGVTCWMDISDIPLSKSFAGEITKAIEECKVFVLIMTHNAQASPYVLRELLYAIDHNKVVLPYIIHNLVYKADFRFLLSASNGIKAYEFEDDGRQELIQRIQEILTIGCAVVSRGKAVESKSCPLCGSEKITLCHSNWYKILLRMKLFGFWLLFPVILLWLVVGYQYIRIYSQVSGVSIFDSESFSTIILVLKFHEMIWALGLLYVSLYSALVLMLDHINPRRSILRKKTLVQTYRCFECDYKFKERKSAEEEEYENNS